MPTSSLMRHIMPILILACLFVQTVSFAAEKSILAVIVANEHPSKTISHPELKLIYWRKKTYWANGKRMHPVNFPADNSLRMQFSNSILGSLPGAQNDYWNGLYFHGTSPPHVVHSDEAMIRYIQETTGSIGYIDACKIDARVKPVFWIMSNGDMSSDLPNFSCDQ